MPHFRDRRASGGKILGLSCLGCVGVAVAGILGLGLVVGVVAVLVGGKVKEAAERQATQATRDASPIPPRLNGPQVTGVKVIAAVIYDAQEARQKYRGATVTLAGTVQAREYVGPTVKITLGQVEGNRATATATFRHPHDDSARELTIGGRATLKGRLTSSDLTQDGVVLSLSDCELVR